MPARPDPDGLRRDPADGWPPISAVMVVVPAHDEQNRIGACLRSVRGAAQALLHPSARDATSPTLRQVEVVEVVVALDDCTDDTAAAVAVADPSVHLVPLGARCVGAARGEGIRRGRLVLHGYDARAVLVVNTDADCVVPRDWLVELVTLAGDHDVVLGEVQPDPDEMTPVSLEAWWHRHPRGRGSLHGANLAVRLDAYVHVGGFAPLPYQEDLLLVRALRAAGASVVGGTRVMTSGRRTGRVQKGFAGYLRGLDEELAMRAEAQ